MNWYTIFNNVFDYAYLLFLAWLLWRWYRRGDKPRTDSTGQMMADAARESAESAHQSAESARMSVETIHNLIALEAKDRHE